MAVDVLEEERVRQSHRQDQEIEPPKGLFTWERPEHAGCRHVIARGDLAAIMPDGTKRTFCKRCNLLLKVR